MRAAAIVFVGVVPAFCFDAAWDLGFLRSAAPLVYGTTIVVSVACLAYALFEQALARFAPYFTGLFVAGALLAFAWCVPLLFLGPFALLPIPTAITLLLWAWRAARADDPYVERLATTKILAGMGTVVLVPLALQLAVWAAEERVTRGVLDMPEESGRALVADVGPWRHWCGWTHLRAAAETEAGIRPGSTDSPRGPVTPRAHHLYRCHRTLAGNRSWF